MSLPSFIADPDPTIFLSDNYLVLDVETDTSAGAERYGHARHTENQLLLACWKIGPNMGVRADWGNELEHADLAAEIARCDFVVAHHAKYEAGWMLRMGIDLRKVLFFDTKLSEYVLFGNLIAGSEKLGMRKLSTSLDMCCRRRGLAIKDPAVDIMIKNGINPTEIPRAWLQGRCEQDVTTTEQVFLSQRTELQRRGLLPVQFTRCLLVPVLADIEREGLAVDPEAVKAEVDKVSAQLAEIQGKLDEMSGGVNYRSPIQMPKFLYETLKFKELTNKRGEPQRNQPSKAWPGGVPLYDSDTIGKLEVKTQKQRAFIDCYAEYNRLSSLMSKNLLFFQGVADEFGGQFFGEISQTTTATQRTASVGVPLTFQTQKNEDGEPVTRRVQLQNTPRTLKRLFRAKREGWLMAEPDGSQIEFRCAALLADDEQAIADIIDPTFDAHLLTASKIHDCSIEYVKEEKRRAEAEGRDDWRQLAKPDTYKPLYGGKYGTPEQERYYKYFQERYVGITKMQMAWVEQALDTKRQVTPWGLTYYWPTAKRNSRGHVNVETAVDNYPIQALATAEIVPIAAVYLWHRLAEWNLTDKVVMVNMVHDSVPCEVHPDAVADVFVELAKKAFTHDVYKYLNKVYGLTIEKVPLGVGMKIGTHWGTGKERAWDIYADGREIQRK